MADSTSDDSAANSPTEDRADRLRARNWDKLALFVIWYAVFVGIFTPNWTGGLEYPEELGLGLYGAIGAQVMLFSLWAGLGPGPWFYRIPLTALASALIGYADAFDAWGHSTASPGYIAAWVVTGVSLFCLYTLACLLVRKHFGWRIVLDSESANCRCEPEYRFQFSLRILLLWMTLAACVMAIYRYHFPDLNEVESVANWWTSHGRRIPQNICLFTARFLPTMIVSWVILTRSIPGRAATLAIRTAWLACVSVLAIVMTYGLRMGPLWTNVVWVVSLQLGASAAGYLVAGVFRSWGYRIVRVSQAI